MWQPARGRARVPASSRSRCDSDAAGSLPSPGSQRLSAVGSGGDGARSTVAALPCRCVAHRKWAVAFERTAAAERFVEDDANRVEVARSRCRVAGDAFGREIGRRTEQEAVAVRSADSATLAMPKSATLASPDAVNKMFAGLTSRWITPASCAAWSARRTWVITSLARTSPSGPSRSSSCSVRPGRRSITM